MADDGPEACLRHFLASPTANSDGIDYDVTFADLITRARRSGDDAARRLLTLHGLKFAPFPKRSGGPDYLLVSRRSAFLHHAFLGTHWDNGRWHAALGDLPGAVVSSHPIVLCRGGGRSVVCALPPEYLDCLSYRPGMGSDARPVIVADTGPADCLRHLFSSPVLGSGGVLLADLITRARRPGDKTACEDLIGRGIKIAPYPARAGGPVCLIVANSHPRLEWVFRGTEWGGGGWKLCLRRIPGAVTPRNPVTLRKGVKPRVVVIPFDHVIAALDTGGAVPFSAQKGMLRCADTDGIATTS